MRSLQLRLYFQSPLKIGEMMKSPAGLQSEKLPPSDGIVLSLKDATGTTMVGPESPPPPPLQCKLFSTLPQSISSEIHTTFEAVALARGGGIIAQRFTKLQFLQFPLTCLGHYFCEEPAFTPMDIHFVTHPLDQHASALTKTPFG